MTLRTSQLAPSGEAEQVTERLAQSEIDIWGERLEPTDISEHVISESFVSDGSFEDVLRGTYYPNLRSVRRLFWAASQPQADKPIPVAIKVVRPILGSRSRAGKNVSLIIPSISGVNSDRTSIKRSPSGNGYITRISSLSLEYLDVLVLYLPL
jgi:hypothetical protein